jgi:glycosyltransferase involved in cell wall biosynthesis
LRAGAAHALQAISRPGAPTEPIRVLRVIARLNVGGPAIQTITLTRRLEERGYNTTLLRGREGPQEGSMDDLAARLGVAPVLVPCLRRDPGRWDAAALADLVRLMRAERPQIVHTHAAKAGTLGRAAALLAFRGARRPILIHTYHGHSLSGYFHPRVAAAYRLIERALGRLTDRLIAVSEEVRDELVAMGVAPIWKFAVVPLGFDLRPFAADGEMAAELGGRLRAELGLPRSAPVVTMVARMVAIKRVDRFLRMAAGLARTSGAHFLLVGDGELRRSLMALPEALELGPRLTWAGFRRDMPAVYFASDVVVQTSDNEGTPVSLIEAQAAGRPVVSTRVGGVASVVADGQTGYIVERDDIPAMTQKVQRLLEDAVLRRRLGAAGRERAMARFGLDRLLCDLDGLYRDLLGRRS